MLNPSQLGALLNFNRHIRERSIGCNVPPICSFLHTQTCQSLARGLRLTGPGERGRQVPAIAIIKAGLWRAPLESYGVLWDFMGGIYHINFPVKDPSGLSGSCTQLSWHGGGVEEWNHCGPLFQTMHPKLHKPRNSSDAEGKCLCL